MSDLVERFNYLKQSFDKANREVSELHGALKQVEENLKEEFGVDTVEEAEEKLKEVTATLHDKEYEINSLLTAIEVIFGEAGSE